MNSKKQAGNAKKQAVIDNKNAKLAEEKEKGLEKVWKREDSDKLSKKEAEEEKKRQAAQAKKERDAELAREEEEFGAKKPQLSRGSAKQPKKGGLNLDQMFEKPDEFGASNINDALDLLDITTANSNKGKIEKHPERRQKSAYAKFEEETMPVLKEENPGLRLSQLKNLLQKKWKKSPDNPMNQESLEYNATREDEAEFKDAVKTKKSDRLKV